MVKVVMLMRELGFAFGRRMFTMCGSKLFDQVFDRMDRLEQNRKQH